MGYERDHGDGRVGGWGVSEPSEFETAEWVSGCGRTWMPSTDVMGLMTSGGQSSTRWAGFHLARRGTAVDSARCRRAWPKVNAAARSGEQPVHVMDPVRAGHLDLRWAVNPRANTLSPPGCHDLQ
jgi:hypothetical protein